MRAPTAVQVDFPLGPERRWQLLLTAAFALFLLTQLIWWRAQAGTSTSTPTLLMAALLSLLSTPLLGGALWRLRRPRAHALRWTGLTWQLISPGSPPQVGTVRVSLDLGGWMLLRHDPEQGPGQWLPVAADRMPGQWHGLRCALANPGASSTEGRHDLAA
jgi:hypothetical protein